MSDKKFTPDITVSAADPLPPATITLDGRSAQILKRIVGDIAGEASDGRRVVDALYAALDEAGIVTAKDYRLEVSTRHNAVWLAERDA